MRSLKLERRNVIELTLAQIADAMGGAVVKGAPDKLVSGRVDTDSRQLGAGDIFFAKLGEFDDGHNYLDKMAEAKVALAVVSTPQLELDVDQIQVSDTVAALSLLAEHVLNTVRDLGSLKVVGITGSNGKTSTKTMLAHTLSQTAKTVAPVASFNNEVGLPLTVLRLEKDTKYLILELGAAGFGSIDRLASWTRPDIGVQLKVGMAHAGEFGGIENTAKIKAEMMPHIQSAAVLNYDDSRVREFAFSGKRIGFGFAQAADIRLISSEISLAGTRVSLEAFGQPLSATLKILGEHQAMNLAASLAVVHELGLDVTVALDQISELNLAERWRMQLSEASGGYWVINDAYNASPDSMRAALQTLATLGMQGHRTIAVLGYMAELGQFSAEEHDAIGRLVVRLNIDQLFVIGSEAKLLHMAATQEGSWDGESVFIESRDQALETILARVSAGDVVLVKASNSAGLMNLGDELAGAH